MKDVGQRIGNFPAVGQRRLQIKVIVPAHQRVEQQLADALRLRIYTHARIKIGGAALDDHHQRVGIGLARAAEEEEQQQREHCYHDGLFRLRREKRCAFVQDDTSEFDLRAHA